MTDCLIVFELIPRILFFGFYFYSIVLTVYVLCWYLLISKLDFALGLLYLVHLYHECVTSYRLPSVLLCLSPSSQQYVLAICVFNE